MISKQDFLEEVNKIKFIDNASTETNFILPKNFKVSNDISWEITTVDHKDKFDPLKSVVGMSTLANAKIINIICKSLDQTQLYVNIGTYQGFSLIAGLLDTTCRVEGVDNFSQFAGPRDNFLSNYEKYKRHNSKFYDQDYVEYLINKTDKIDFYFYDGPHKYSDQYNAIKLASKWFKKDTIIMIDDTNDNDVKLATFEALNESNVEYDIWLDVNTAHNKHPTFWNGILIIGLK